MLEHHSLETAAPALLDYAPPARRAPLAERVERALRNSPYLSLRNIRCDLRHDVLVLSGCLPSYFLKQMAHALVMRVEGVGPVANEIDVVATATVAARR